MKALWILPLVFTGCVATDVGNPQTDGQTDVTQGEIEFEAYEAEALANALMLDDGVELTEAWLVTDRVVLKPCDDSGDTGDTETETDSEDVEDQLGSITATELLTGTSYPASPLLNLSMADYCGFELRPSATDAAQLPQGAPDELSGLSMLVRGMRKDGTTFEVRSELEDSFDLDGGIHVDSGRVNRLVVGFAVNGWVNQRDLGPLTGEPIIISPDSNPTLYETFEETVSESARLFDGSTTRSPIAE